MVFVFNPIGHSKIYGIGTYINNIINFYSNAGLTAVLINASIDINEFKMKKEGIYDTIDYPIPNTGNTFDIQYSMLIYMLKLISVSNNNIILHINDYRHFAIAKKCKKDNSKCKNNIYNPYFWRLWIFSREYIHI